MTARPTNAELVASAGRALFGDQWQSPTARLLGISIRSMQYMAAAADRGDSYRIPSGILLDLAAELDKRAMECRTVSKALRDMAAP